MTADATADAPLEFERDKEDQAWARWIARGLDAILMYPIQFLAFAALGVAIELGRAPRELLDWLENPLLAAVIGSLVAFLFFCLWEPLFISNIGTTPGKWVMGIRVLRADGRRLGAFTALARFIWVWTVGLAFGIPFVAIITMLIARARLVNSGVTAWDEGLKVKVTHTKRHPVVWGVVIVLVIGANVAVKILERMGEGG